MVVSKCNSCNKSIANDHESTEFLCPKCAKVRIIRCSRCREISVRYKCAECGFVGP